MSKRKRTSPAVKEPSRGCTFPAVPEAHEVNADAIAEHNEGYGLYWWIPLPDPIGLPSEEAVRFTIRHDFGDYLELLDSADHDGTAGGGPWPEKYVITLIVRQLDKPWRDPWELKAVDDLAREMATDGSTKGAEPKLEGGGTSEVPEVSLRTTVIAVEVISPPGPSPSDQAISGAFDEAISCIQRLQRAYHLVSPWPMRLVNRESLPPWIPWSSHNLRDQKSPELKRGQIGIYQLHLDVAAHVDPGEISEQDLVEVHSMIDRDFGAFFSFSDLHREATVALHRRGDYRSAVLAAATAAEVFLDDLLLHLLWEEKTRPEDAASLFTDPRRGIGKRINSDYAPRLGGRWETDVPGPTQRWLTDIAKVRHRAVHAGHQPTLQEARAALDALFALQRFGGDRLAERGNRFGRTALAFSGQRGLERRGKFTKRLKGLQQDGIEPDWTVTFSRWRDTVSRHRADAGGIGEPADPRRARLVVVIYPDDSVEWILHDRTAAMAARTNPDWDQLPASQADVLRKWTLAVSAEARKAPEHVPVAGDAGLIPNEDWVAQHRRLPHVGVMVSAELDRY